ncbi:reverse transcriptase domain-containing protein [Tanacetum coccineum]|uniref:Reverse transcriptase domain-containing protein n=1 Tax=Tanacetum coccineum TaxID=301880 RepID=A0ABQ4WY13_9ASTR
MAAYQRMIAETDPTRREEALTETSQNSAPVPETALDRMHNGLRGLGCGGSASMLRKEANRRKEALEECGPANYEQQLVLFDINSGIDTQMLNQLIATRVAEALAAAVEFRAVMHESFRGTEGAVGLTRWFEKLESQFGISNVAEGDRVKFASSTLLDGALTWWNVYVRSVTLDTAHATPWSDFKAMFIRKYCPRNEIKQMENELWNLKVKGTNLTAYNQRFQELILLCPEMDLHEAIEMAQGLMYQVVQELGENSGDKRKWNGSHYNHNPNNTSNLNPNKCPEAARVFTAGQGSYALSSYLTADRTYGAPPVPQTKEDQEAKKDREVMSIVSNVAKKDITRTSVRTMGIKAVEIKFEATRKTLRTIRGRINGTLREVTKHQPALKEDAKHLAVYTACAEAA